MGKSTDQKEHKVVSGSAVGEGQVGDRSLGVTADWRSHTQHAGMWGMPDSQKTHSSRSRKGTCGSRGNPWTASGQKLVSRALSGCGAVKSELGKSAGFGRVAWNSTYVLCRLAQPFLTTDHALGGKGTMDAH